MFFPPQIGIRKTAVLLVAALIVALAAVLAGLLRADSQVESAPSTEFAFQNGERYHIVIEQYRRYGSQKQQIESSTDKAVRPELAIRDISFVAGEGDSASEILITVSPVGGTPWYSWSSPDGRSYKLTNHRTGDSRQVERPVVNAIPQAQSAANWSERLTNDGWTLVTTDGETAVFEISGELGRLEDALSAADKELSPVGLRHEAHVDLQANIVVETSRYLLNASGDETLVEYFKVLEIENVQE